MEVLQRHTNEYSNTYSVSLPHNHNAESITGKNMDSTSDDDVLGMIARSRIRWGVVEMPPEWYKFLLHDEQIGHLSFGVEADEVLPPEHGRWYE